MIKIYKNLKKKQSKSRTKTRIAPEFSMCSGNEGGDN